MISDTCQSCSSDLRIPKQQNPAVLQLTRYGELLSVTVNPNGFWIKMILFEVGVCGGSSLSYKSS